MPPYLEGIINLRGNVIPVLDLALKFGIGETPITKDTSIIVAEISGVFREDPAETVVVGVYSDMVLKVVEIPPEAIEPPRLSGPPSTPRSFGAWERSTMSS
jgi:purine-binding chemotaxis protein CheW